MQGERQSSRRRETYPNKNIAVKTGNQLRLRHSSCLEQQRSSVPITAGAEKLDWRVANVSGITQLSTEKRLSTCGAFRLDHSTLCSPEALPPGKLSPAAAGREGVMRGAGGGGTRRVRRSEAIAAAAAAAAAAALL